MYNLTPQALSLVPNARPLLPSSGHGTRPGTRGTSGTAVFTTNGQVPAMLPRSTPPLVDYVTAPLSSSSLFCPSDCISRSCSLLVRFFLFFSLPVSLDISSFPTLLLLLLHLVPFPAAHLHLRPLVSPPPLDFLDQPRLTSSAALVLLQSLALLRVGNV
jgi:hypothetical protein